MTNGSHQATISICVGVSFIRKFYVGTIRASPRPHISGVPIWLEIASNLNANRIFPFFLAKVEHSFTRKFNIAIVMFHSFSAKNISVLNINQVVE